MTADKAPLSLDDMIGRVIEGRYRIDRELGEGGLGCVYVAQDQRLGREVALKVLLENFRDVKNMRGRFEREAKALSALSHPNIVTVLDYGVADDLPFLVMELVGGRDLFKTLYYDGPFTPARAVDITKQVLRALAHAHAAQIVHRDLKPSNVMLQQHPDGSDHAVVLDFGLVKFLNDTSGMKLTRTGALIGTPTYMAPEQCSGDPVDLRADVYATALILYEMLCGRPPFKGHQGKLLESHLLKPPPPFSQVVTGLEVDPALWALLDKALQKQRADRYTDAGDMLNALDALGPEPARWTLGKAPELIEEDKQTEARTAAETPEARKGTDDSVMATQPTVPGNVPATRKATNVPAVAAPGAPRGAAPQAAADRGGSDNRVLAVLLVLGALSAIIGLGALGFILLKDDGEGDQSDPPSTNATVSPTPNPTPSGPGPAPSSPTVAPPPPPPQPDPWTLPPQPLPAALASARQALQRGQPITNNTFLRVRRTNDFRENLMIGHLYYRRNNRGDSNRALIAYERTLRGSRREQLRHDPMVFDNLLEMVENDDSRTVRARSVALIVQTWGASALPYVEEALATGPTTVQAQRLRHLRSEIQRHQPAHHAEQNH